LRTPKHQRITMGKNGQTVNQVAKRGPDVKLALYIAKMAKELSISDKKALTMSSAALAEVELLVEHAVLQITNNAEDILKYSGGETLGVKTAAAAAKVGFSGLLRDRAHTSGINAIETYEGRMVAAS